MNLDCEFREEEEENIFQHDGPSTTVLISFSHHLESGMSASEVSVCRRLCFFLDTYHQVICSEAKDSEL